MQKTTKMKFFYLYNNTVREYLSREKSKKYRERQLSIFLEVQCL